MEYPMICLTMGEQKKRTEVISEVGQKNGMLGVNIHGSGHKLFFSPMIINSDERQWELDGMKALNTFVQFLTDSNFGITNFRQRGPALFYHRINELQKTELESQSCLTRKYCRFGPMLIPSRPQGFEYPSRTIMGRKPFDYAFKEIAEDGIQTS